MMYFPKTESLLPTAIPRNTFIFRVGWTLILTELITNWYVFNKKLDFSVSFSSLFYLLHES